MSKPSLPSTTLPYNISPSNGVGDRNLLNCTEDGRVVDLWTTDDDSGRQRWHFVQVASGIYNIKVAGGVQGGELLSCTPDGKVDLYTKDDESGRQRWKLTPLENGSFNIEIAGGTNQGETFLSCTEDGKVVDLYYQDDDSGRQQWRLIAIGVERTTEELDASRVASRTTVAQLDLLPIEKDIVQCLVAQQDAIFKYMDRDKNRALSFTELKSAIIGMGFKLIQAHQFTGKVLAALDKDKDGEISIEEIKSLTRDL